MEEQNIADVATEQVIDTSSTINEAQQKAQEINRELAVTRTILNADQLASLIAPRARLEKNFEKLNAYFFTIDGVLNGKKVQGALFAGECMLVFATTERHAQEQANAGLRATIELIHEEFDTRSQRELEAQGMTAKGLAVDAGGRKGSHPDKPPQVHPKLNAIMQHIIGGKPFKY